MKVYSLGISFILESQGRLPGGSDNRRWPAEEWKEDFSRRRNNMGKGPKVRSIWMNCRVPSGSAGGILVGQFFIVWGFSHCRIFSVPGPSPTKCWQWLRGIAITKNSSIIVISRHLLERKCYPLVEQLMCSVRGTRSQIGTKGHRAPRGMSIEEKK